MCLHIPDTDELFKLRAQLVFGLKVNNSQAFALKNAEPLFDLIHPGAMHRDEVHEEAGMLGDPLADLLPVMGADIVADEMNRPDVGVNLLV